jgi:hypothetical protein
LIFNNNFVFVSFFGEKTGNFEKALAYLCDFVYNIVESHRCTKEKFLLPYEKNGTETYTEWNLKWKRNRRNRSNRLSLRLK